MKPRRSISLIATIVALLLVIGWVYFPKLNRLAKSPGVSDANEPKILAAETFSDFSESPREVAKLAEIEISKDQTPRLTSPTIEKIAARMSTRSDDLQIVSHADGRESMDLRGRFMHLSARVTKADGTSVVQCFSSADALAAAASK